MLKDKARYEEKLSQLSGRKDRDKAYPELVDLYLGTLDRAELDERDVLEAWKSAAPKHNGAAKPKLVIVTVTGGANRSALWTATVLHELDKALPDFARHVRLVAGASGGMVAQGTTSARSTSRLTNYRRIFRRETWPRTTSSRS